MTATRTPQAGDMARLVSLPPRIQELPARDREIYELCQHGTFKIAAVKDGRAVFDPGQAWHHVADDLVHETAVELACWAVVEPIPDAQWTALSAWYETDASLDGVVTGANHLDLIVQLPEGIVAELPRQYLPQPVDAAALRGKTLSVRLVTLSRVRHVIRVAPAAP